MAVPSSLLFVTHRRCPYAQKTWITLNVSGAPYEMVEISLYGPGGKPDWFLALNPKGEVPVLRTPEGQPVPGSEATLDFVVTDLVPHSPLALATAAAAPGVREWRDNLIPAFAERARGPIRENDKEALAGLVADLEQSPSFVGPYLCGHAWTLADCSALPFLERVDARFDLASLGAPRLAEWRRLCKRSEAYSRTVQAGDEWWWWW